MRYDAVIATLNRPESLANCLSMIEKQSEQPARVVIVDAGSDHERLRANVLAHRNPAIEWIFVGTDQKNSPYQRNLGLRHVTSEVVITPDDDCMLHPDAATEMMAGFRADSTGLVAAIGGVQVGISPLAGGFRQMQGARAFKDRLDPLRNRVEARLVPKPFNTFPQSLWPHRAIPAWVDGDRFRLVATSGGGLTAFRSEVVKEHQFDQTLGHGIGYALHEDMEFDLRIQRLGYLIIAAQRASIFHDAHPGKRAGGFNYGFCWIANYLYVCRKNIPQETRSWARDLPRFLRYKAGLYHARALVRRDLYSRDVLEGARTAWSARHVLMDADAAQLPAAYDELCNTFIRRLTVGQNTDAGPAEGSRLRVSAKDL
jgi:GT2 family glycosyltransferase